MLNYDEVYDELEKTQSLITKEIRKVNQKNDLTPQELGNLTEAVCLMEKIIKLDGMIEAAWDEDGEESEYYDHRMSNRGRSYRGMSNARGRSPRTGRFVSRREDPNMDGRGISRHSIEDRMIAALENQMDYAGSDYERQRVGEWIEKMRAEQK